MNNDVFRIGILMPPGNVVFEREARYLVPEQVVVHYSRLSRPDSIMNEESLLAMNASLDRAAHDLAQSYPDVILYGCTGGSFLSGAGHEADIAGQITRVTGVPALTTTMAVLEALTALKVARPFLASPYPDEINEREVAFLRQSGFDAVGHAALNCATSEEIRAVPSERVEQLVLDQKAALSQADGVFISCANLLTADRISSLEEKLGKPVISSVQASLWAALKRLDIDRRGGIGRLFQL